MTVDEILTATRSVLLVDWPSRDVPDTLARAGYDVVVHGGPAPDDYSVYAVEDGEVVVRRTGTAPRAAELVYSYRPVDELPAIVEQALALGAAAVWVEPGDPQARAIVESAGLAYVDEPLLADAVRAR